MLAQHQKIWLTHLNRPFIRSLLMLMLLLPVIPTSAVSELATSVVKSRIDRPVPLQDYLVPVTPPQLFSTGKTARWYQLDVYLNPDLSAHWLLSFRRIPQQTLDIYLPDDEGYTPYQLGQNTPRLNHDPRTLELQLQPGQIHRLYLKTHSPLPNQLTPVLWPASLYTLAEYRHYALSASALTLVAGLLVLALIVSLLTRNGIYLVPALHFFTLGSMLALSQGTVFRTLHWPADPGHTLLLSQTLCLITALLCYQQLEDLSVRRPAASAMLTSLHVLAITLITGFIWQPGPEVTLLQLGFGLILLAACCCMLFLYRTPATRPAWLWQSLTGFTLIFSLGWNLDSVVQPAWVTVVFCLQAITLTALYYLKKKNRASPPLGINLVTGDDQRRIFENSLRQHLHPSPVLLDEAELKEQVLATLDAALPRIPALLVTRDNDGWHIDSHHLRASRWLKKRLNQYYDAFMELITAGAGSQVRFQERESLWAFLIHSEGSQHIMLVILPLMHQQLPPGWRQAVDISSHARALFQASQQTRFWQLQASLDTLTGLLNRNAFIHEAEAQLSDCHQRSQGCCLLFIDIDHFKEINDRFGHPVGDKVLNQVARHLRDCLRHQDLLGRYGGEEFIILLPNTTSYQGYCVAERIRKNLAQSAMTPHPVTLSLGVAASNDQNDRLEPLLKEADAAMYQAKRNGRNRVIRGPSCRDFRFQ